MSSPLITQETLFRILVATAGESDALHGDALNTPFEELDYDSLALMEAAARIKQEMGVSIPEEELVEVKTPREMLDLVNELIGEAR
ncbi:acyl carrier protein [Actinomadura graeca]|uniref:Acyl carrier protein n=1 Tax=Actinomadura graeca TaxID=2750812 RepID=A0ABX8QX68_9ACTN|nr:acyl carrier protein [Actinomadura graeca]QXJ23401.1 acyl carrier protein [Actinomadura graeca]